MKVYIIQSDDLRVGDIIKIEKILGNNKLIIDILDLDKPQIRLGPKFKKKQPKEPKDK